MKVVWPPPGGYQPSTGAVTVNGRGAGNQRANPRELWEADRRTVVMVTHDVDEAILLSDRILVMSPSPDATVIADIAVDLPRPRSNVDPDPALRYELINLLHP